MTDILKFIFYSFISLRLLNFSFHRYISVLVELTKVEGTKHGALIAEQVFI